MLLGYLRYHAFLGLRYMALQWRVWRSDEPWTQERYNNALLCLGFDTEMYPSDGDYGRCLREPINKNDMWPWLVYIQEEPDWAYVKGRLWLIKGTRLIRFLRLLRKLWPWSRWHSLDELGSSQFQR